MLRPGKRRNEGQEEQSEVSSWPFASTPLQIASIFNNAAAAEALLEAGAKAGPRFANAHGESPRDVAVPGSKARKAMDERIAALHAERGRRAVGVHTEDWSQALLALDRATRDAARPHEVLTSIDRFFDARLEELARAGVAENRLIVDPGMGRLGSVGGTRQIGAPQMTTSGGESAVVAEADDVV